MRSSNSGPGTAGGRGEKEPLPHVDQLVESRWMRPRERASSICSTSPARTRTVSDPQFKTSFHVHYGRGASTNSGSVLLACTACCRSSCCYGTCTAMIHSIFCLPTLVSEAVGRAAQAAVGQAGPSRTPCSGASSRSTGKKSSSKSYLLQDAKGAPCARADGARDAEPPPGWHQLLAKASKCQVIPSASLPWSTGSLGHVISEQDRIYSWCCSVELQGSS
jgi:hypothetical protein